MTTDVKVDADALIKRLEEHLAIIKEERHKLKANGESVEVVIKVKKRKAKDGRHKRNGDFDVQTHVHRAGSWGDLLLKKKQANESRRACHAGDSTEGAGKSAPNKISSDEEVIAQLGEGQKGSTVSSKHGPSKFNNALPRRKTSKPHHSGRAGANSGVNVQVPGSIGVGGSKCCNACTCHQLRTVKDQESQTSMLLTAPPSTVTAVSPPTKDYGASQSLRQSTGEAVKPKVSHSAPDKSRGGLPQRRISSSRRSANIPITRVEDAEVQTKERSVVDEVDHAAVLRDLKKLNDLEMENAKLKRDTTALLQQMDKAKAEKQEYITTIKELYELAEVLRHENVILIGTHEEHRALQEKLIEALGENQVLKQHLQELTTKASETGAPPEKQAEISDFWKVRDVLKEVKTVIAQEISGLQKSNGTKSPIHMEMSDIVEIIDRAKDANMNDTNVECDDEIRKILNISKEVADRSDLRSSTQYLEVEESHAISSSRRYVPSPSPSSQSSA